MSEGLDNLLAEAFAKSIFKEKKKKEEREEGEIDSGDEKKKSKKSKHKSKCKSKAKHSKSERKAKDENESEVMKLLLSSHLKSYAQIPFKDTENDVNSCEGLSLSTCKVNESCKSSKETNGHKKSRHSSSHASSKKSKHSDHYCDNDYVRYYDSKSNIDEDYYYGSYYEGSASKSRTSRKRRSRPLSPLYEESWKVRRTRSKSRSPLRRSDSSRRRSLSPYEKRSKSPFFKSRHYNSNSVESRRSLSPYRSKRKDSHKDDDYDVIDKQKLLQIARENLLKMIEKGDLPKGTEINRLKLRHLRELTTQKSVQQWTEFCRAISALGANDLDLDSDLDFDSDDDTRSIKSDHPFTIRHPFKLKERKDIEIKVRNFIQLPNRSATEMALELRQQFPVSSGNQHRRKELEWQEVEPTQPSASTAKKAKTKVETPIADKSNLTKPNDSVVASTTSTTSAPLTPSVSSVPSVLSVPSTSSAPLNSSNDVTATSESVFPKVSMPIDIGSIMAQRLSAMRKLNEDPHNVVALKQMFQSQEMMREWAESKIIPGQFTGSTDAEVLTGDQLSGPVNAWTRKDQFKTAAPITDGIGMYLLMKMGWNPGQGLGKRNDGTVDPIMLEIKFDKKGLVAAKEEVRNLPLQLVSVPTAAGKHPVSMLHELCAKKKWIAPNYEQVFEQGPDHRKNFMFKVIVNGVEYQPSVSSSNKKQARALAAGVCLQAFGLLPKDQD